MMQERNASEWQVKTERMNREGEVAMVIQMGSAALKPAWRN